MIDRNTILVGDCKETLAGLPANSMDAVVTDPPYGLSTEPDVVEVLTHWLAGDDYEHSGGGFMGKTWDGYVPGPATWSEVFRVLKPGGHALVFAGSRTYDMMTLALRIAGFEVRTTLQWIYGQGMPKGQNISKAIDKRLGVEREVVGPNPLAAKQTAAKQTAAYGDYAGVASYLTAPGSPEAAKWEGFNTQLKPSWEPIIMARKPPTKLSPSGRTVKATIVDTVLEHGTGGLNVDACRVGTKKSVPASISKHAARDEGVYEGNRDGSWAGETGGPGSGHDPNTGRYPADTLLSHSPGCVQVGDDDGDETVPAWECEPGCPVAELDQQSGDRPGMRDQNYFGNDTPSPTFGQAHTGRISPEGDKRVGSNDAGGASRFFAQLDAAIEDDPGFMYSPKAAKRERNAGLPDGEKNGHPTVKPLVVMRWLVKLVTPPDGVVLDPFLGSGTTAVAAALEGFDWVGCEMTDEYVPLAEARVAWAREQMAD